LILKKELMNYSDYQKLMERDEQSMLFKQMPHLMLFFTGDKLALNRTLDHRCE
jgi:hypothetical protein